MKKTDEGFRSPLADRVAMEITQRIDDGLYAMGGVPSERALADELGVSRATVRRAVSVLEERGLVARAARCRTMARTGPSARRKTSAAGRSSIGLWIWPSPADPSVVEVIQGVSSQLGPGAYRLIAGQVSWHTWDTAYASEADFLERLADDADVAGLLIWHMGGNRNREAFDKVRAAGIPITFLGRLPPQGIDADWVGVDNEYAAERIVSHLLGLGHKRIAHVTNPEGGSTVAGRVAGYRMALESHGVAFDEDLVATAPHGSFSDTSGAYRRIVDQLMAMADRPTAIFAVNDVAAERLAAALSESGVGVPDDVALAGFDGMERWRPGEPFLTTVHQPFERIGARGAQLLLRRIQEGPNAPYYHVVFDGELSVHRSTVGYGAATGATHSGQY